MKRVHGTIVMHMLVEATRYKTDAYCDECLDEQTLRPRPEEPRLHDEYEIQVDDEEILDVMRNAIPGVVRDHGVSAKILGYRCSGCDRRLDLGEKA